MDRRRYQPSDAEREEQLTDAYRNARTRMKPLLVYLVPPEESAPETQKRAEALEKLIASSCELVCAGANQLKRLIPDVETGGDVSLVLVETDRAPPSATCIKAVGEDVASTIRQLVGARRISPHEADVNVSGAWFVGGRPQLGNTPEKAKRFLAYYAKKHSRW